jgi:hypothetical protein
MAFAGWTEGSFELGTQVLSPFDAARNIVAHVRD